MGFTLIAAACAFRSPKIERHPLAHKIIRKLFIAEIALATIFGVIALYSLLYGRPLSHKSSCMILGLTLFSLSLSSIGGAFKVYFNPNSPSPNQGETKSTRNPFYFSKATATRRKPTVIHGVYGDR